MTKSARSIERVSTRAAHVAAMRAVNSAPGLQRKWFADVVADLSPTDRVLSVQYGKSIASITADGTASVDKDHEPGFNAAISDSPNLVVGSVPSNKRIGNLNVPCGVCAIVALGGAGKTPLAHALASYGVEEYSLIRVGEPLVGYTSNEDTIAKALAEALLSGGDIVLDSIKDLLASGGNLMKSGLSRDVLTLISSWSAAACTVGATIYIPINPSVDDPEIIEMLLASSESNATMAMVKKANAWEYSVRTGEGLARQSGSIDMAFNKDEAATIVASVNVGKAEETLASKPLISVVNANDRATSLRRSMLLGDQE